MIDNAITGIAALSMSGIVWLFIRAIFADPDPRATLDERIGLEHRDIRRHTYARQKDGRCPIRDCRAPLHDPTQGDAAP